MTDDWKAKIDKYLSSGEVLRRWQQDKNNRCNYPGCSYVSRGEIDWGRSVYVPTNHPMDVFPCNRCAMPVCSEHQHKGICRICAENGLG